MTTYEEFAWAAFLYGAIGGDKDYMELIKKEEFLTKLRQNPKELNLQDIRNHLIKGFLNKWKCRVINSDECSRALKSILLNHQNGLLELSNDSLEHIDFEQRIQVNERQLTKRQIIISLYDSIQDIGFRFAATATSKLLHILNPNCTVTQFLS